MPERVRTGFSLEFSTCKTIKRPSGTGQKQPAYFAAVPAALQALKNGAVFAVNRNNLRAAALRGGG